MKPGIASVTLNPAIDQTLSIPDFRMGEVNRVVWEQSDAGGKGVNVAAFLADHGFRVTATGLLGAENASLFQALFASKRIADRFVRIAGRTRTNIKIVDARRTTTDINLPGQPPLPSDIAALLQCLLELCGDHEWFALSGSIPSGLDPGLYGRLVAQLRARGKHVVLDASGEALRLAIPAQPTAIKPNIAELRELVGEPLATEAEILRAARRLVNGGIACVVVSMGAQGALFVDASDAVFASADAPDIRSTVGAGDAMVAGLIAGLSGGASLEQCARLASAFSLAALAEVGARLPPPAAIGVLAETIQIRRPRA